MTPDLAALFRMRPERAADFLAAKDLRLTGPYWALDGPGHSQVFTVANLAKLDVLADIKSALQEAIDTGQTERWTKERLVPILQAKGWWGPTVEVDPTTLEARIIQQGSLRRLQTIYRTNLQSAYMAGRHRQAMAEIDRAPYAQYLAVRDSRTRPAHAAMHGRVFRLDSPEWSLIGPGNGYNCRCRARYLSERELTARGLSPETDVRILERDPPGRRPVDPLTGETPERWIQRGVSVPDPLDPNGRAVLYADTGWDHLPGSDGAERALVDRLMAKATLLGDGVREVAMVTAPPMVAAVMVRSVVESDAFAAWWAVPEGDQPVAAIAAADAALIGAKKPIVMMSPATAMKQRANHPEIAAAEYAWVQACVERGERIHDAPSSLIYLLEDAGYVTVVKATRSGEGLWLTSFRRLSATQAKRDGEIRRLRRKGGIAGGGASPPSTG